MNKDKLKKHHFWILAGLVPLFVLLAVLLTWTGASGEIAASTNKINGEVKTIKDKNPKGVGYEKKLDEQKVLLGKKVGELWEANWRAQRDLIVWPKDGERGRLANFLYDPGVKTKDGKPEFLKFGTPFDNSQSVFEVFQNEQIYEAPFERAAKLAEPTQFLGGWKSIFRLLRGWGAKTPTSDVLWLTLEDLWVQRGLMMPIKDVNDSAAAFHPVPVKPGPDGKPPENKFAFRSRIWEVEFEIASRGQEKALLAKLTNVTDRLQLLGARNSMTLNVWFDTSPSQEKGTEFRYKIEAEFVQAGATMPVTYLPTFHQLDAGANPTKVTKVEQVFDARTVPIRRIDRLQIGYLDNRHQNAELKTPTFIKAPEVPVGDPGTTGAGPGGMVGRGAPMSGPGGPGGAGSSDGGAGLPGVGPGGMGTANLASGWEAFLETTKKRYIDVTEQVRRIPVAMVLVVDQDYERDLLIALANSQIRFQITQYHCKRFRGSIATGSSGDSSDEFGTPDGGPGTGYGAILGGGLGGDDVVGGGRGGFPGRGGAMAGPGVISPSPGGAALPGTAGTSGFYGSGPPRIPGTGPAGFPGAGPAGFPGGGATYPGGEMTGSGVAETSAASGLIEISIYGIVTLYERFEEPKTDPAATAPVPAPANTPAAPTTPTGTTPPADKPKQ